MTPAGYPPRRTGPRGGTAPASWGPEQPASTARGRPVWLSCLHAAALRGQSPLELAPRLPSTPAALWAAPQPGTQTPLPVAGAGPSTQPFVHAVVPLPTGVGEPLGHRVWLGEGSPKWPKCRWRQGGDHPLCSQAGRRGAGSRSSHSHPGHLNCALWHRAHLTPRAGRRGRGSHRCTHKGPGAASRLGPATHPSHRRHGVTS